MTKNGKQPTSVHQVMPITKVRAAEMYAGPSYKVQYNYNAAERW